MAETILATKLIIPKRSGKRAERQRLFNILDKGSGSKLSLVSAGAGFGKTTLLSEWVRTRDEAVLWLSLDEGDNDLSRFITYLMTAFQQVSKGVGKDILAMLMSPEPPDIQTLVTLLINDISSFDTKVILVLDDYHFIDNSLIDAALAFLVQHMPPMLHLIISSREDPNLPLSRLRAKGELREVRSRDLRFTKEETEEFLNTHLNLGLSGPQVKVLSEKTEGWIAGLLLAALSLEHQSNPAEFISSFAGSNQFVLDYLTEEVLKNQSQERKEFLLSTSILKKMCASLCDRVLDRSPGSSQEILEELSHRNLFIVPLDNERKWFRYHHLFRELLVQRFSAEQTQPQGADTVREYHHLAAQWFEEKGMAQDALYYAGIAEDFDMVCRLIAGKTVPLHFQGHLCPVVNCLESLPEHAFFQRPFLLVMFASALSMTGRFRETAAKLNSAEEELNKMDEDDETRNLRGHIAAIRALIAALGNDPEKVICLSNIAMQQLSPANLAVRSATTWKLGWAYQMLGRRADAEDAFHQAVETSVSTGNMIIGISAKMGLAIIKEKRLLLEDAVRIYREIIAAAENFPLPVIAEAYLGTARCLYQQNNLQAAMEYADTGISFALRFQSMDRYWAGLIIQAKIKAAENRTGKAVRLLDKTAKSALESGFPLQAGAAQAEKVRIRIAAGDIEGVGKEAGENSAMFSRSRLFLARSEAKNALAVLNNAEKEYIRPGWESERLTWLVLMGMAFRKLGKDGDADQCAEEAVDLAMPAGCVRPFLDEGRGSAVLFQNAVFSADQGLFVKELLQEIQKEYFVPQKQLSVNFPGAEPLSSREIEVLVLLAQGLSNLEIGERLFVTESTIKGHNRHIFEKLQVKRRTEAVRKASELGLI
ncbi:MAG: LuxR C-terminal-related transcriptional regulator [Spirochaetia bacterium]